MGCFVVARFVLTSVLCGPSAIAELLVIFVVGQRRDFKFGT